MQICRLTAAGSEAIFNTSSSVSFDNLARVVCNKSIFDARATASVRSWTYWLALTLYFDNKQSKHERDCVLRPLTPWTLPTKTRAGGGYGGLRQVAPFISDHCVGLKP